MDKNMPSANDTNAGAPKSSTTRRKFSVGAAAGAGVLLTLGNRVAWGRGHNTDSEWETKTKTKTKTKKACISERVWESYVNDTNTSFDPKGKHSKEVSKFQEFFDRGVTGSGTKGDKFCAIKEVEVTFQKTRRGGSWRRTDT
jgi:hypothetical protein